jgi:hypothetical protein
MDFFNAHIIIAMCAHQNLRVYLFRAKNKLTPILKLLAYKNALRFALHTLLFHHIVLTILWFRIQRAHLHRNIFYIFNGTLGLENSMQRQPV